MNKDNLIKILIESILIIVLFLALFLSNIFNKKVIAAFLLVISIVIYILARKKKNIISFRNKSDIYMILFGIIYVSFYYLLGIFSSFYESPTKFGINTILNFIIPYFVIIISTETIRNTLISKEKNKINKISNIMLFIIMILIDTVIYTGIYDLNQIDDFLAVIGFVIFASISCNLFFNYMNIRFGYKGLVIYRLITTLYMYIIPIVPNVYLYFSSFLKILYPYIMYLVIDNEFFKVKNSLDLTSKNKNILYSIGLISVVFFLVAIISCNFKYGVIAIGTNSMNGSIDKGDAIIYESYSKDKYSLYKGDVIVFYRNGIKVVHRIVDRKNVNGKTVYITKGDANYNNDEGYVSESDVIGKYLFKIRHVGFPSVWLSETFSK